MTDPHDADGGALLPFDHEPRTRLIFGAGSLLRLGALARELGGTRILLVTDPGIRAAGHVERAERSLREAGCQVAVFDHVEENPTTVHVDLCKRAAEEARIDLFVAVGGGSSMDAAKGANFLLTNGGRMQDYWGVGKATRPMLPMIAVPTTAGTGSEAQSFALIADAKTHEKMACGDKKAACRIALLDPEVTVSQPAKVTAVSGVDAIAHAVESFVTTRRNPLSNLFAREAWRLLTEGFEKVLAAPGDLDARGRVLLGAHFAGCAIEASMLGATHSAANPLTAHFGATHGAAIGVMLPTVVRFNAPVVAREYAELLGNGAVDSGERLAERIAGWVRCAGLPTSLSELEVPRSAIPDLAEEASRQWTAQFNPRPVAVDDFRRLYESVYNP